MDTTLTPSLDPPQAQPKLAIFEWLDQLEAIRPCVEQFLDLLSSIPGVKSDLTAIDDAIDLMATLKDVIEKD